MKENEETLEKLVKKYVEDNVDSENKDELENIQNIVYEKIYQEIETEVINKNKSVIIEEYKEETKLKRKQVEIREFEKLTLNTIILGFLVGMLVNSMTSLLELSITNIFNISFTPWWGHLILGFVLIFGIHYVRGLLKGKSLEEWLNELIETKNN